MGHFSFRQDDTCECCYNTTGKEDPKKFSALNGIRTHDHYVTGAMLSQSAKTPKTSKQVQMVRKFPGKVSRKSEIVEFPKSGPFNRKFREENQMELKFSVRNLRKSDGSI